MLYVSFRRATATNGDRGLMDTYRNKVQVHKHAEAATECVSPVLLGNLDADGSTADTPNEWPWDRSAAAPPQQATPLFVVRVVRIDVDAGVATVELCRWAPYSYACHGRRSRT